MTASIIAAFTAAYGAALLSWEGIVPSEAWDIIPNHTLFVGGGVAVAGLPLLFARLHPALKVALVTFASCVFTFVSAIAHIHVGWGG